MKKKADKKKKNPQDATLRNVRAASKKIAALTKRVKELEDKVREMGDTVVHALELLWQEVEKLKKGRGK